MFESRFCSMRSCNDDYVPMKSVNTFTSSTRDENADEPWSPTMRMKHTGRPQPPFTSELINRVSVSYTDNSSFTRSTCAPIELEKRYYTNENSACISQYPDTNIHFHKSTPRGLIWELNARFIPDAKLEALDAKLEELYNTDVIMMEVNLSEPDEEERPNFNDDYIRVEDFDISYYHYNTISMWDDYDSADMTPRGRVIKIDNKGAIDFDYDDDHYEEFSLSDRFNEDEDKDDLDNEECCEYCQMSKKIVLYNWRCEDGGLCEDCANLLTKNDDA